MRFVLISSVTANRNCHFEGSVLSISAAVADQTNQLVAWTDAANPSHDAVEYDAIVASGEQNDMKAQIDLSREAKA